MKSVTTIQSISATIPSVMICKYLTEVMNSSISVFLSPRLAEDILDSNPSNLILGSNTRIKWTDGTIYSCKYLGRKRVLLYHIKVGHEIRQMQRHEFSLDIPPPSPPPTPCEMESDLPPSRSLAPKRANQQAQNKPKRRRRLLLSSSSSSSSSEES